MAIEDDNFNDPEEFIKKYGKSLIFNDRYNWDYITDYYKLDDSFLNKYKNDIPSWDNIIMYQKLSKEFIEDNLNYFNERDLFNIYRFQILDKESMIKLASNSSIKYGFDKGSVETLITSQRYIDKEIIDKLCELYTDYKKQILTLFERCNGFFSPPTRSGENKRNYLKRRNYKCYDDYFIGYVQLTPDSIEEVNGKLFYKIFNNQKEEIILGNSIKSINYFHSFYFYDSPSVVLDDIDPDEREGAIFLSKIKYSEIVSSFSKFGSYTLEFIPLYSIICKNQRLRF